jgi:hypothetical protein
VCGDGYCNVVCLCVCYSTCTHIFLRRGLTVFLKFPEQQRAPLSVSSDLFGQTATCARHKLPWALRCLSQPRLSQKHRSQVADSSRHLPSRFWRLMVQDQGSSRVSVWHRQPCSHAPHVAEQRGVSRASFVRIVIPFMKPLSLQPNSLQRPPRNTRDLGDRISTCAH